MSIWYTTVIVITKLVSKVLKLTKHNAGNVPGRVALRLAPQIRRGLKVTGKIIVVTGTNGKTTTAGMLAAVLSHAGNKVIVNEGGNNIDWGITTTLVQNASVTGKIECDYMVLETDEHWVPVLYAEPSMRADTIVMLDFFRDQLDRAGEMETIVAKLEKFVAKHPCKLVLNGDDPNVVRIGRANKDGENYYYGAGKLDTSYTESHDKMEGIICPYCQNPLKYDYYQYSHLGKFHCPKCDYKAAAATTQLARVGKNGEFYIDSEKYTAKNPNLYNIYNILAVVATSKLYKIWHETAREAIANYTNLNGRYQTFNIKGRKVTLNLCKNPTGYNVVLRPLKHMKGERDLLLVLNDHVNDGHDVSWIWDVDFSDMGEFNRIICAGMRPYDLAVVLKCNGYNPRQIVVLHDKEEAIMRLLRMPGDKYVISNYSALEGVRKILTKREQEQ